MISDNEQITQRTPIDFECRFVLRNQAAESLLRSISLSR
jgi:hypothetical protein